MPGHGGLLFDLLFIIRSSPRKTETDPIVIFKDKIIGDSNNTKRRSLYNRSPIQSIAVGLATAKKLAYLGAIDASKKENSARNAVRFQDAIATATKRTPSLSNHEAEQKSKRRRASFTPVRDPKRRISFSAAVPPDTVVEIDGEDKQQSDTAQGNQSLIMDVAPLVGAEMNSDESGNTTMESSESSNGSGEDEENSEQARRLASIAQPDWSAPAAMAFAQTLDFDKRIGDNLRPTRFDGTIGFAVNNRSRPTERMRWIILLLAREWGYNTPGLAIKKQTAIANAACRLVAYDFGFQRPPKGTTLADWNRALTASIQSGSPSLADAVKPKGIGYMGGKYTDNIEREYPGYLTTLFREAQKMEGNKASWKELARAVNFSSQKTNDERPVVNLTAWQLRTWFKQLKGRLKAVVPKPILTQEHKDKRVAWATKILHEIRQHYEERPAVEDNHGNGDDDSSTSTESNEEETNKQEPHPGPPYYCFLDEKWFYTTSRRRKIKFLPRQPTERTSNEDHYHPERLASRRFATKVMFMGVVACPHPEHNFNGKILLKRVSKKVKSKQNQFYKNISDNFEINKSIHKEWRDLNDFETNPDISVGEYLDMLELVGDWEIDDDTREHLRIRYRSYSPTTGKHKWNTMSEDEKMLGKLARLDKANPTTKLPLALEHLHLQFLRANGEEYDLDCTCDSAFMKANMLDIGEKIRKAYEPWVPSTQVIHLIMDNAGGHGTKDCIDEYVADLLRVHNVKVVWQIPRSPECNLLDLGIWCGLQRYVEKLHRKKTKASTNALSRTVMEAWERYDSYTPFRNVYKRWANKVLPLIIAGHGDNVLVDKARKELVVPIVMQPPGSASLTPEEQREEEEDALEEAAEDLLADRIQLWMEEFGIGDAVEDD